MQRTNQPVGELAVLHLEKDGVELHFGYIPPKDDPEAYQAYLMNVWPEIRQILETYRKLPDDTEPGGIPSVNTEELQAASDSAIAQALFEQYLAPFQEDSLDALIRLSDYRIDEVEIPSRWQPCAELNKGDFIATITYSVQPALWPPERWTEDGYQTFDRWITRKKASIAVFPSGENFTMKILEEPVCPGF
jgi:hypothetical protein